MTNVTCGLTAKKPGSAPCPTLLIEYGTTLLYFWQHTRYHARVQMGSRKRIGNVVKAAWRATSYWSDKNVCQLKATEFVRRAVQRDYKRSQWVGLGRVVDVKPVRAAGLRLTAVCCNLLGVCIADELRWEAPPARPSVCLSVRPSVLPVRGKSRRTITAAVITKSWRASHKSLPASMTFRDVIVTPWHLDCHWMLQPFTLDWYSCVHVCISSLIYSTHRCCSSRRHHKCFVSLILGYTDTHVARQSQNFQNKALKPALGRGCKPHPKSASVGLWRCPRTVLKYYHLKGRDVK